jgi:hypothetical protein
MKKVAFTLMLMEGPEVAGWVRQMGEVIDGLNPLTQNFPAVWETFLAEFEGQYQDTQKDTRA